MESQLHDPLKTEDLERSIALALGADYRGVADALQAYREVVAAQTIEDLTDAIRGSFNAAGNFEFVCPPRLRAKMGADASSKPVTVIVVRELAMEAIRRLERYVEDQRQAMRRKMARVLAGEGGGEQAA